MNILKNLKKCISPFFGLMFLLVCGLGCSNNKQPHTLVVIEAYEEDVDANDNVVEKDWRTLCEIEDGSRAILKGKWGAPGDTLKNMVRTCDGSEYEYWNRYRGQSN